jgi:hypothetical protein
VTLTGKEAVDADFLEAVIFRRALLRSTEDALAAVGAELSWSAEISSCCLLPIEPTDDLLPALLRLGEPISSLPSTVFRPDRVAEAQPCSSLDGRTSRAIAAEESGFRFLKANASCELEDGEVGFALPGSV